MATPHPLDNASWHALCSHHAHLAVTDGEVRRYPSDVSPFGAAEVVDDEAWHRLATLTEPGQPVILFRAEVAPPPEGWRVQRGQGHQMTVDRLVEVPVVETRRLGSDDVPEMLALVDLAKPGPFRSRTIELGDYLGVFDGERLLAMAGERFRLPGYTEISAVCTHPDARGRGLAAALTRQVALAIQERGERPFLHVAEHNDNARRVYERLGFTTRRMVDFVGGLPPT